MKISITKRSFGAVIAVAILGVTGTVEAKSYSADARADGPGTQGTLTLSIDRMFGYNYTGVATSAGNPEVDTTYKQSSFSLLWAGKSTVGVDVFEVPNPYATPRFAVDYAVTNGLTIGGSIGYAHISNSNTVTTPASTRTNDNGSSDTFVIAPRIGYYIPIDAAFGFWPRAGFTYYHSSYTPPPPNDPLVPDSYSVNGFALDLEANFVINLAKSFGIYIGLAGDIGLSGSESSKTGATTTSNDATINNFAVTTGMLGSF